MKGTEPARATHFLEREEVITWKDSEPIRDTHNLERSGVKAGQNT